MKDSHVMAFIGIGIALLIMGAITYVVGNSGADIVFSGMSRIGISIFCSGMISLGTGIGLSFSIKPLTKSSVSKSESQK